MSPEARARLERPMPEAQRSDFEREIEAHGDVLPPWQKFPELERYSIGWRMGYGEPYLALWWAWTEPFDRTQLLRYFKRYAPYPREWLDWIADELGMEQSFGIGLSDEDVLTITRWLETMQNEDPRG